MSRKVTLFKRVFLAVANKKDIREYMKFIYCDGENIAATDGQRLHIAPNTDGLAIGYYDKRGNSNPEIEFPFPKYKRIIPNGYTTVTARLSECEILHHDDGVELVKLPSGQYIQKQYLNDALGAKETFDYSYDAIDIKDGVKSAIKIESDGLTAIIMPYRM